jgi:hypothetical protein
MHHRVRHKSMRDCFENKLLVNHMGRAFSPCSYCVYQFPGALPRACMERAFSPSEIYQSQFTHDYKLSAESAKYISMGQRPRKLQNEKATRAEGPIHFFMSHWVRNGYEILKLLIIAFKDFQITYPYQSLPMDLSEIRSD